MSIASRALGTVIVFSLVLTIMMLPCATAVGGTSDWVVLGQQAFDDVDLLDATHGWAVGREGAIAVYNGSTWTLDPQSGLITSRELRGVCAISATDVWAVGYNGTVIHYNGVTWSVVTDPVIWDYMNFDSVSGASATDIWVVGEYGRILHYKDSVWSDHTNDTFNDINDIQAVDTTHIWAVSGTWSSGTSIGKVLFCNGTTWEDRETYNKDLYGIYALDNSHIWAVGGNDTPAEGIILYYDGTGWSVKESGAQTDFIYQGVVALDSTHVWAVGFKPGIPVLPPGKSRNVSQEPVGLSDGGIFFYDGSSWSAQEVVHHASRASFVFGVDALNIYNVWGCGGNQEIGGSDGFLIRCGVTHPTTHNPEITELTPDSGPVETEVTIDGRYFGFPQGSSYVTFNGVRVTDYVAWSDTQIRVTAPNEATTGNVYVTNSVGTSNGVLFTVIETPSPYCTWYLAEGSTAWGYDCYISIENPNTTAVSVAITYMTSGGPISGGLVNLAPLSRATVNPEDKVGQADFSTRVFCRESKAIAVDRTMTWTGLNAASEEAHNSIGVISPDTTWYLPEGSSAWGFECWLLLQNPNNTEATCDVVYMIEGEGPRTFEKKIPANTRRTYSMADEIGNKDASIKVSSDLPIIPERAMYRNNRREGHDSIGTVTPARDYYLLAEGTTAWGFTTYILVQNPNNSDVEVNITFMTPSGPTQMDPFVMSANTRKTIRVNDILPNTDLSTSVHGSQPVIAERAMYWDNGAGEAGHDSIGMSQPHTSFWLPDGETCNGRETWTLVANPNQSTVTVEISYLGEGGIDNVSFTDTIEAQSRKTYKMADKVENRKAAILVECKSSGKKIMTERAMYWNSRGAGTDTIGGASD